MRVMSSNGMRYFGLIANCVSTVALASTLLVGIIAWETRTALSVALWSVVLPLEITVRALMKELASGLGGTCIGYALVVPTVQQLSGYANDCTI